MQGRNDNMARIIDISHFQDGLDWEAVKAAGIVGMIAKVSQGAGIDPTFVDHIAKAKSAGLLVGGYHFLDALTPEDAVAEVQGFADHLAALGGISRLDFPPVLDFEATRENVGLSREIVNQIAQGALETLETRTGVQPMLYTGNGFAQKFDEWAGAYPLWVARYNEDPPWDVTAWTAWEFWQYSETADIGGMEVDCSVWAGTEEEMRIKYDKEVRKQMEELKQALEDLRSKVATLEQKAQRLEQAAAPDWFVQEFGSGDLSGLIDTPQGDDDFWRTVAVAARMIKGLKIQEGIIKGF